MKDCKGEAQEERDQLLLQISDHHHLLLGYAFSITRDWILAEDMLQETYVSIAEKWHTCHSSTKSGVFCWARRILRNRCIDYFRARRDVALLPNEIPESLELAFDRIDEQRTQKLNRDVKLLGECFKSLDKQSRKLLYDFYVKGESCINIAMKVGQQARTPVVRLHRLRKRLLACMRANSSDELTEEVDEEALAESEPIMDRFFSKEVTNAEKQAFIDSLESGENAIERCLSYILEYTVFATVLRNLEDGGDLEKFLAFSQLENDEAGVTQFPEKGPDLKDTATLRRVLWPCFYGLAACIVIGFAIWNFTNPASDSNPIAVVANGTVIFEDGTKAIPGSVIHKGETISIPEGSPAVIKYDGDGSIITIAENSNLTFIESRTNTENRVRLNRGELLAEITRQKSGTSLIFDTPHASVFVLGTKFRLTATPSTSKIVLLMGKVSVSTPTETRVINAMETATVEQGKSNIVVQPAEVIQESEILTNRIPLSFPQTGVIAYYPFNEGKGINIGDYSTYNAGGILRSGPISSIQWTDGIQGSAISFPGKLQKGNDKIIFERFPLQEIRGNFTIAFWINANRNDLPIEPDAKGNIIKIVSVVSEDSNSGWVVALKVREGGESYLLGLRLPGESSSHSVLFSKEPFFEWGKWNHCVISYAKGTVQIYQNGKLNSEAILPLIETLNHENKLIVYNAKDPKTCDVILDEIVIFNRPLSLSDVQKMNGL